MYKISFQEVNYTSSDGRQILSDISFDLSAGSILSVIGPSGAGKSTLLRLINRLSEVSGGIITIDGQDIKTMDVIKLRQKVGIVFQNPRLFPGTVEENILYGPALKGITSGIDASEFLELSGLDRDYSKRRIDKLSGGEQQRVSIARALANNPEILLLDEPTSALDPSLTDQLERTFVYLRDQLGLTLVWVTHNLDQARRVSDVAMHVAGGRNIEFNKTNIIFESPSKEDTAKFLNIK